MIAVIMAHQDDGCIANENIASDREGVDSHFNISGRLTRGHADKSAIDGLKQEQPGHTRLGAKTIEFADLPDNAMTPTLVEVIKHGKIY